MLLGRRPSDNLLMNVAHNLEFCVEESDVTKIAVSALFAVYESTKLTEDGIYSVVRQETGMDDWTIDPVVVRLFENKYLQLSNESEQAVVFGTSGLWLLESAFTHGQEDIDSMAVAERILRDSGFFRQT
jgi:hypothetical protein